MPVSRKGKEFSRRTKLDCWEAAGGRCQRCQRRLYPGDGMHYDHIIPIEQGGGNDLENCQLLCTGCHSFKTGQDAAVAAKGRKARARHVGAKTPRSLVPGSKGTRWKKRLDGTVERRED